MTSEMRERVKEIVDRASQLPVDERRRYVEETAAGDEALLAEALRILEALDANPGFMSAPTVGSPAVTHLATPLAEGPGTRIGAYKLLQKIGEGGFGTVFVAEQTEPVTRRVALKIIKLGMDTRQVIARFEQERQALAMMDHPHIARVLDAGATAAGRPFFVMELCAGQPVTQYADTNTLNIRDRLELFVQVCHAVQHAHQKGVIHRDIKPSNVLVHTQDGRPHAKVIDFGIAKATAARLTTKTLFTEHGQFIGTPQYMSPEQAAGSLDVDTRSDVYSLGVLLYELLTGATPFDPKSLRSGAFDEIVRMIREVEAPKPSTRLSGSTDTLPSVAAARSIEPRRLGALIRGDLDWIVMKALDKDRARRYETANGLAADILQHLAGAPVVAAPPSAAYRLRKFVRRNRVLVSAVGSIAAVLLLAIIGMSLLTGWALRERSRAENEAQNARLAEAGQRRQAQAEERAREKAEAINLFVTRALVSSDPQERGEQGFLVTDAMNQAIEFLDAGELKDQPATEAALRLTISKILAGNAKPEEALRLAERALAINQQLHPGDHPDVAWSLNNVAGCLLALGRSAEALAASQAELEMYRRLYPGDHPDVAAGLNAVGTCLHSLGRDVEALPDLEAALSMRQRLFNGDHADVAESLSNVGACLQALGRPTETLSKLEAALAMHQRLYPGDHPDVAWDLQNVALCLQSLGRPAEAAPMLEAALEMRQRLFAGDHPDVAKSLNALAYCLHAAGRTAEVLPKLEAALEMRQRLFPGDHPDVAESLNNVAACLQLQGRPAEALPKYQVALAMHQRLFPDDHPDVALGLNNVAACLRTLGRLTEALPQYEAALAMYRNVLPANHPATLYPQMGLARTLVALGRYAGAEPLVLDAAEQCTHSEAHRRMHWQSVLMVSVELYDAWHAAEPDRGHDDTAAEWRAKLEAWQATTQPTHERSATGDQ